jgi:hypothetical protein
MILKMHTIQFSLIVNLIQKTECHFLVFLKEPQRARNTESEIHTRVVEDALS